MLVLIVFLIFIYFILFLSVDSANNAYYIVSTIIYIVINIWYLYKYRKGQLICFEFFFALSFFACSFLTTFVLPVLDEYTATIFVSEHPITIFKAHIVAYLGYLLYMLGLVSRGPAANDITSCQLLNKVDKRADLIANLITSFFIVMFFLKGGVAMYTMYSDENIVIDDRLGNFGVYVAYSIIGYSCSIVTTFCRIPLSGKTSFMAFVKMLHPLFIINSLILILSFIISGYRSNAIQLLIPLLLMYNRYVRPISFVKTLCVIALGSIVMIYIGEIRQGEEFNASEYTIITYFRDFYSANAANVFLIDYTDFYGPAWSNTFFQIMSVVPGLQGIVNDLFIPDGTFSAVSSVLFTDYFNRGSGLGTNIIGDLYYSYGLGGVMILMYGYGLFVNKVSSYSNTNIYALVLLLVFSGNAVFAARVEYFYILRSLSFSVIILFLLIYFSKLISARNTIKY